MNLQQYQILRDQIQEGINAIIIPKNGIDQPSADRATLMLRDFYKSISVIFDAFEIANAALRTEECCCYCGFCDGKVGHEIKDAAKKQIDELLDWK